MGRLTGKVAIVTGGAQGIGAAYAQALCTEGAKVCAADILDTSEVVNQLCKAGGNAIGVDADITDTSSVNDMVAQTIDTFGQVDILVNNAALFAGLDLKPFMAISDDEWDKVMNVNISGLFRCCRAVVPHMQALGGGKIINISSGTVFNGAAMMLHYVTSKAAVVGFTRSLAREVGGDNICVNALAPGLTLSEGVENNPGYSEVVKDMIAAQRAIPRGQTPEDLLGALIFLASSDSDFMTGQTMLVDGGHYTH
jgi:NAD(P)-dependent dehydrogenase (short-subunit alcohol dehydrogenase family)